MKQVSQRLRDGRIEVLDVPPPSLREHGVLVDVRSSLLSAGTERSKVETGRQSLLGKARSRPDQVRQVVEKARRDGVRDTVASVRSRLDRPDALGYSSAGVVTAVGASVRDLAVGDRVACGGGGYATHADVDYVPGNLCVRLPEGVEFDRGAFVTVGAIALQGVRQAEARLGERVAVVGLGLVGQLTGQLLRAAGCHVTGIDLSAELVRLGEGSGAVDRGMAREEVADAEAVGACDAAIITAATPSDDPVELAARLCRDRGRVVVVGDVGLRIPRAPFYEKELDLRLSRSYGPGRYDREYEERGLDYPVGYVRWTERRNMAAFVELLATGRVDPGPLVRERVPVEEAPGAYDRLLAREQSSLGILIHYGASSPVTPAAGSPDLSAADSGAVSAGPEARRPLPRTGVIGAGSFATRVLVPALEAAGFPLEAVASAGGLSARAAAQRFAFARADTPDAVLEDPAIGLAAIATRHASHADLAERALERGKAVFVEKPPCLTEEELDRLRAARDRASGPMVVGFNRRYAPLARRLRDSAATRDGEPLELSVRVNAGPLDPDHWLNDPGDGGGRLLGEGCHFLDLACWLVGALPVAVSCSAAALPGAPLAAAQRFAATLSFEDGSVATVLYGDGGNDRLGKERIEAHWGGRSAVLDDFRTLTLLEGRGRRRCRDRRQDKGHTAQAVALRERLEGRSDEAELDPLDSMGVSIAALRSAETGGTAIRAAEAWRGHDLPPGETGG